MSKMDTPQKVDLKIPPISPPDVDRLGKHDTNVPCAIQSCKGTIIEERNKRYLGDPMNAIIGPGHANQLTLVVQLYCSRCGVAYHHLPEQPRAQAPQS